MRKITRLRIKIKRKNYAEIIFLLCFVIILYKLLNNDGTTNENYKNHMVIISTTFYAQSTIYTPNTFALLINMRDPAHDRIQPLLQKKLICITSNQTHTRKEPLAVVPAYPSVILCKWSSFYALCESVANPKELKVEAENTFIENGGHKKRHRAKIPFRYAYTTKRKMDVINCFSPLYFYERWQSSITAFEIFRHFGVQLQIFYVESVQTDIYKMLKIYEEMDLIKIEPWTDIKIKFSKSDRINYDINAELEWRNQPAAHLDCLFKYRESTNWIILGDVDDILLPKIGRTYADEFKYLLFHYPYAAAFRYARYNTKLSTSINAEKFSLEKMLTNVNVSLEVETGKVVLNTARVKTTWLHWLGDAVWGSRLVDLDVPINIIFHFRNYTFKEEEHKHIKFYKEKNIRWAPHVFDYWLDKNAAKSIEERFRQFLNESQERLELYKILPNSTHYFDQIDKCYDRILYSRVGRGPPACPGPQRCALPMHVPGLKCTIADRKYKKTVVTDETSIYVSPEGYKFYENQDGCLL